MKTCSKCKIEKELTDFYPCKRNKKDGLRGNCKMCGKEWNDKNKDKIKIYNKNYKHKPVIYVKPIGPMRCSTCKIEKDLTEFSKNKRKPNGLQSRCKICCIEYSMQKKEIKKKYDKERRIKNNAEIKERRKERRIKNNAEINKKSNDMRRERKKHDSVYKMICNLRSRMNLAIKKGMGFKNGSSQNLLGCNWETVKYHLESQFKDGMSWENYGYYGWHIDHIKPCSSFDLSDPEEQRKCFHYTNLQPLKAEENLKKGNKLFSL